MAEKKPTRNILKPRHPIAPGSDAGDETRLVDELQHAFENACNNMKGAPRSQWAETVDGIDYHVTVEKI